MSDTAVAAPPPAPAPSAPASPPPQQDIPIQQLPAGAPTPIGSQTPDKSPEVTRREALQRAMDKHQREVKPPAEAKMGHNQPPEPTQREAPKAKPKTPSDPEKPTLDLRKPPTAQPEAAEEKPKAPPRERGEHGHFAPSAQNVAQTGAQYAQTGAQNAQNPYAQPYAQPLSRMSKQAKADWGKVPESVRADMHRMHNEFGKAFIQYRGDHDAMNEIRPFAEMARQQGTSLKHALTNFTQMEHKLRSDPVGALDVIVNNLNLQTDDGQKISFHDLCWHVVNQTPEQRQLIQSRNAAAAQAQQLAQANQRIAQLENHQRQMQYREAYIQTRGGVEQYANLPTRPRFDELGDLIEQEVKLGFDLDTAYQRANLLRPAGTAPQTRTNGTAAQTRTQTAQTRTDRSIAGSPAGPSNGTGRPRAQVSRRDAIAGAVRRHNGAL